MAWSALRRRRRALARVPDGQSTERNASRLREFLAHPIVEVLPVDLDVAQLYGEIFAAPRHAGTPIPTNDIWIAATAARAGAAVLTFDAHFRAMTRVGSVIL